MLVIMLVLFVSLFYYIYYRSSRRRVYDLAAAIPDVDSWPLVGNLHMCVGGPRRLLRKLRVFCEEVIKKGGLCKVWLGPQLYIVITKPEDAQMVLENCLQKDFVYKFLRCWLGNGLFVSTYHPWKMQRRVMLPVFHPRVIEEYIDIFGQQGQVLVQRLTQQCGKGEFDVFKFITSCTLDIIFESAVGESMAIQTSEESAYLKARHAILHIINMRLFKLWMQPDCIFNLTPYSKQQKEYISTTHAFTDEIVERKRKIYESSDRKEDGSHKPMLELLFSRDFTNVQLREHIDSITIAGNDATALVLSYALVLIGAHPDVQEKLYNELETIFGSSDRQPNKADMAKMLYMERVIKEAMRLYTVVPIIARTIEKETQLSTCTIPAGTGCVIATFSMHRNKKVWGEDADSFDPDRFLPEHNAERHPCAYIPFSHGARNCIELQPVLQYVPTVPAGIGLLISSCSMHRNNEVWGENADSFDPDRFLPEHNAERHSCAYIPFSHGARNCIGRLLGWYVMKTVITNVVRNFRISSKAPAFEDLQIEILLFPIQGHQLSLEKRTRRPVDAARNPTRPVNA